MYKEVFEGRDDVLTIIVEIVSGSSSYKIYKVLSLIKVLGSRFKV